MEHGDHRRTLALSPTIALLVEGETEVAFLPAIRSFLAARLTGAMPRLQPRPQRGRLPTGEKLKRMVENLLEGLDGCDYVVALTDVHTGTREFADAADAIEKMRRWVGPNPRFHAHAAQHDVEAWLLPYWPKIQKLSGSTRTCPAGPPESVNHGNPPSRRIMEAYRTGARKRAYKKQVDGAKILEGEDLGIAARRCPELKAFLDTIIHVICGGKKIS